MEVAKQLKSFNMEAFYTKSIWIIMGMISSLIVGVLSFIIRSSISSNATKESVKAKTDLLEKDIAFFDAKLNVIDDKILQFSEVFVKKEDFIQAIREQNHKLDTILKFVQHEQNK